MGLYIKGLDMPKNCTECFFHKVFPATGVGINQLYCALCGINILKLSDAQPDCPLVEVPTPHGRLIDTNEFLLRLGQDRLREDKLCNDFVNFIAKVPTVIPAEDGE